jgi:hypothetical protein
MPPSKTDQATTEYLPDTLIFSAFSNTITTANFAPRLPSTTEQATSRTKGSGHATKDLPNAPIELSQTLTALSPPSQFLQHISSLGSKEQKIERQCDHQATCEEITSQNDEINRTEQQSPVEEESSETANQSVVDSTLLEAAAPIQPHTTMETDNKDAASKHNDHQTPERPSGEQTTEKQHPVDLVEGRHSKKRQIAQTMPKSPPAAKEPIWIDSDDECIDPYCHGGDTEPDPSSDEELAVSPNRVKRSRAEGSAGSVRWADPDFEQDAIRRALECFDDIQAKWTQVREIPAMKDLATVQQLDQTIILITKDEALGQDDAIVLGILIQKIEMAVPSTLLAKGEQKLVQELRSYIASLYNDTLLTDIGEDFLSHDNEEDGNFRPKKRRRRS